MKKILLIIIFVFALQCMDSFAIPAFPGAEGFGAESVGGRGGEIYEVTNLNNAGTGSLRDCVENRNFDGSNVIPRTCVFRTGGTINLDSRINIESSYLTIAGQTAPGGGILVTAKGDTVIRFKKNTNPHDIIIRYLRLRNGKGTAGTDDVMTINSGYNLIFDHISFSWGNDEVVSIWGYGDDIHHITFQRLLIAECLEPHNTGFIIGGDSAGWHKIHDISIHHNLFVHNDHRNPRVKSPRIEVINNVVYNWGWHRAGGTSNYAGPVNIDVDFIGNYIKAGPSSNVNRILRQEDDENGPDPSLYTEKNVVIPKYPSPDFDNWLLWTDYFSDKPIPVSWRRFTPLTNLGPYPVTVQTASEAYSDVIDDVGANARLDSMGNWVRNPDSVDTRYISEVRDGTGWDGNYPSTPSEAGGFPSISSGTAYTDSDHDGMPDEWEISRNLNPNLDDSAQDRDGDGYTNIEEYINGISGSSTPTCTESDWTFTDGLCEPSNALTRTWTKITNCQNGVQHSAQESVSCVYQGLAGDLNLDGTVDLLDLILVARNFEKQNFDPRSDANNDGAVNIQDLILVAKNFGS